MKKDTSWLDLGVPSVVSGALRGRDIWNKLNTDAMALGDFVAKPDAIQQGWGSNKATSRAITRGEMCRGMDQGKA